MAQSATRWKQEARSRSRKQEANKQNEKHGNEACTETRWRQVQRFSSALLCLSDLMGRRKEEEYNTKMVDGYEAPQQKEVRRPVAPRSCGWRPGTLYLGAWPDGSGQARYWARGS